MIKSPVLIVGCARSGTTLLYNVLAETADLWSIGYESKAIIERCHHPSQKGWVSGELSAGDLTVESRAYILRAFERAAAPGDFWRRVDRWRAAAQRNPLYGAIKRRGRGESAVSGVFSALPGRGLVAVRWLARVRNRLVPPLGAIRLLDKSPENCLRLPFLEALFPDARIIFLARDARPNIYSLMEGWRQPHLFPGYATPVAVTAPGQTRGRWAFTLIPGWRDLAAAPLEVICARQWMAGNAAVLNYAAAPGALPVLLVRYEELVAEPHTALEKIADFLDLAPADIPAYGRALPEVNVVSPPGAEKWRGEAEAIARVEHLFSPTMARLGYGNL
jgi:hypothetical protein